MKRNSHLLGCAFVFSVDFHNRDQARISEGINAFFIPKSLLLEAQTIFLIMTAPAQMENQLYATLAGGDSLIDALHYESAAVPSAYRHSFGYLR